MSRKNRTSGAEDLMNLVAMLPWWVGVASGAVSYFVLHAYAAVPVPVPGTPIAALGTTVLKTGIASLAGIGQYLVPVLCFVGAALSATRRMQRKKLLATVATGDVSEVLNTITWQQFELVIGEWFRTQGYAVREYGGAGPDGGIDLVLTKGNETFLVQCKQWRAIKVGVSVVRELYGVMAAQGATGGFVITSGSFTADAKEFANGRNVQLFDGKQLAKIVARATPGTSAPAPKMHSAEASSPNTPVPNCPQCGGNMAIRTAKRGASAGQQFWGCQGYPSCKGTLK